MTRRSPFRFFKTSPEILCLAVMMYVRFPLSLRNVEDLHYERGIDLSHESVRFWWVAFLAPDIIRAVWDGKQPTGLTTEWLMRYGLQGLHKLASGLAALQWPGRQNAANAFES